MAPGVAPPSPTARLGHSGDVHSGLLKPSPSSNGSAMVQLGRRCLILTKKASKGVRATIPALSFVMLTIRSS